MTAHIPMDWRAVSVNPDDENKFLQFAKAILDKGVDGFGRINSAKDLAEEYLNNGRFRDNESRIDSIIKWEISKNFGSGFVTGLGGLITLPISIPASLAASWIIQARLVAAIALLRGYDIKSDHVRTMVLATLVGHAIKDVVREAGIRIGTGVAANALKGMPGKVLIEINRQVGFRLLTKAGQTGVINMTKLLPLVGGVIGGSVDAISCKFVAGVAKANFPLVCSNEAKP